MGPKRSQLPCQPKKQEGKQRNERTDNEADDQVVAKKRRKAKGTRETRKRTRSEEGQSEAERHPKQPRRGKKSLKEDVGNCPKLGGGAGVVEKPGGTPKRRQKVKMKKNVVVSNYLVVF